MSKLNKIETELMQMDGAKFHKLCNAYLSREGYKNLTSVGLTAGKDKSITGTPDTLITLSNGHYIFVEVTTKQERAGTKFQDDIKKCFEESKTGISVSKIDEIILCYNLELTTHEIEELNTLCENNGCALEVIGLATLSNALFGRYPELAKDFLGIEMDTGQILTSEKFVQIYGTNRLATPLDTLFFGREQELEQIKKELAKDDVLILSGCPGSGKTRIALQAIEQYRQENPQYQSKCIHFHGEPIYDDIKSYFSASGSYIILVDDANRLGLAALDSFLYLIQDRRPDRRVKLILTVRDYALNQVIGKVRRVSQCIPVEISPFNSDQLIKMLSDTFGILNPDYQMRIWSISRGNPRLAVMCANIALENNTLQSLNNVSDLYRNYYESIRSQLSEAGDNMLLVVASIVAFLRVVDISNSDQMNQIHSVFGVDKNVFVEKVKQLDRLEIVDVYENEMVKVSDQILGTYLLFLSLIEERILDIDVVIRWYFSERQVLFTEAINPLHENFGSDVVSEALTKSMSKLWREWLPQQSDEVQCQFISIFWYVNETETLDIVARMVNAITADDTEVSDSVRIGYWSKDILPDILATLFFDGSEFGFVGKLIVDYLRRKPSKENLVKKLLTDKRGVLSPNLPNDFSKENTLITLFWRNRTDCIAYAATHIFIALAKKYLYVLNDEWKKFHTDLWDKLLSLYSIAEHKVSIRELISNYFSHFREINEAGFLELDAEKLLPFLYKFLDPEDYDDCMLFHKILKGFRKHKIEADIEQEKRFRSKIWTMAELLIYDRDEMRHDVAGYQEQHQQRLLEYVKQFDEAMYHDFFAQAERLLNYFESRAWETQQIVENLVRVALSLQNSNEQLFLTILLRVIKFPIPYLAQRLVPAWLELRTKSDILGALRDIGTDNAIWWMFQVYAFLPIEQIMHADWRELFALYQEKDVSLLPAIPDFILKYIPVEPKAIIHLSSYLLDKGETDARYIQVLATFFRDYGAMREHIVDLMQYNNQLLFNAYFSVVEINSVHDYECKLYNALQNLDSEFTLKYIQWFRDWYRRYPSANRREEETDFSVLWMRDDYEEIMGKAFLMLSRDLDQWEPPNLKDMIEFKGWTNADPEIVNSRQQSFIHKFIEQNAHNNDMMDWLFDSLSGIMNNSVANYLGVFLKYNSDYEVFKELPMEPTLSSWSGSRIPVIQQRMETLETLRKPLDPIKYAEHRQLIDKKIKDYQWKIECEKRKEWTST